MKPDDDYYEDDLRNWDDTEWLGQCARCGCPIKNEFGLCESCDFELALDHEAALQEANREMLGEDADYFEAAGIDDVGNK